MANSAFEERSSGGGGWLKQFVFNFTISTLILTDQQCVVMVNVMVFVLSVVIVDNNYMDGLQPLTSQLLNDWELYYNIKWKKVKF